MLVGYIWLSLSYPIFLSSVTLVCNRWFNDKERGLITTLAGLSLPIGTIVSFTMSGVIFGNLDNLTPEQADLKVKSELGNLLWD